MSARELSPLRAVLSRAVAAARFSVRTVEEALGCPDATAAARHRLADWIGPANPVTSANPADAAPRAAAPTPEELAAMIRTAVREELAARQGR